MSRRMPPRKLIVNADDLGYTPATTAGILAAHERGIVTSASLMVRPASAAEAVLKAEAIGFRDLGLHLDLGEWVCRGAGEWTALYEVVDLGDAAAVAAECERQLARFRELTGRDPTHLDSHQHVHRQEPVRAAAVEIARRLAIPLRDFAPRIAYRGDFYGQYGRGVAAPELLTEESIVGILRDTTAEVVEVGCHPGWDPDLETMYCHERIREVEVLCSPTLPGAIADLGFELTTFAAVTAAGAAP